MKRAFLLSGGGAHGGFQVGVIDALAERGELGHDIICGTSVGALNGACIYGPKSEQNARGRALRSIWDREVHGNASVYQMRFGGMLGAVIAGRSALASTAPLESIIRRYWKGPISGVDLRLVAVDELSGRARVFDQHDADVPQKILASASFPGVFDPVVVPTMVNGVRVGTQVLTDGGVRDIIPYEYAMQDEAVTHIDVIATKPRSGGVLPLSPGKSYSLIERMMRTAEILADEVFLGDIRALERWQREGKDRTLRIFAPPSPIETDPLDFRPSFFDLLCERGRRAAEIALG